MLSLASDVSMKIDDQEYIIQKDGIFRALTNPSVAASVARCAPRGMAIAYLEWSSRATSVVPFTLITNTQDLNDFAARVRSAPRSPGGRTDVIGGLNSAVEGIFFAPFESKRMVVDISSNGEQDVWPYPMIGPPLNWPDYIQDVLGGVRDRWVKEGVVINALVIQGGSEAEDENNLVSYFENNVAGGPNSFVRSIQTSRDYQKALELKLRREICNSSADQEEARANLPAPP